MSYPKCIHDNGPDCAKCAALDIPEVEELEQGYRARIAELEAERTSWLHRASSMELLSGQLKTEVRNLEAELDTAKGWKARAVEALEAVKVRAAFIGHPGESFWDTGDGHMIPDWRSELLLIEQVLHQPALDWLAQREREAIVRELTQLGPLGSRNPELFAVPWSEIKRRIAALATQQPTACPRSEGRKVGES